MTRLRSKRRFDRKTRAKISCAPRAIQRQRRRTVETRWTSASSVANARRRRCVGRFDGPLGRLGAPGTSLPRPPSPSPAPAPLFARVDPARASDPVRWHRADALRRVASSSSRRSRPRRTTPRRPPPLHPTADHAALARALTVPPSAATRPRGTPSIPLRRPRRGPRMARPRRRSPPFAPRAPSRASPTRSNPAKTPRAVPRPIHLARALLVDAFDAGASTSARTGDRPRRRRRGQTPRQMRLRLRRALPPPRGRNRHVG